MRYLFLFLLITTPLSGATPEKVRTLYNSLDPHSVPQHLALYELYSTSPEGQKALQHAWDLLAGQTTHHITTPLPSVASTIDTIVALVNKLPGAETPNLSDQELQAIERLAQRLPNRKLKGFNAKSERQVLALAPDEIDLARALLLTEVQSEDDWKKMRSYEAMLDLMALQILVKTPFTATPKEKIRAINHLVFEEMRYRFPPHSLYAKDVDLYTFLPSVIDSRKGVCLGVSILYICLAQRLDLSLEMITPPGHIYVRYRNGDEIINIETTARGIHLNNEVYLGIETRSLQQRDVKEVVGLAHFNQAGAYWSQGAYDKIIAAYKKAEPYIPDDMLYKELLGYAYIINGDKAHGDPLMHKVRHHIPDYAITGATLADDYLKGATDADGMRAVFMSVDETRESILKKKEALETAVAKHPRFRAGLFSLAITWLQLHRPKEALKLLEKVHTIDPNDPEVEYYLAALYAERYDDNRALTHLKQAEKLVLARDHAPHALRDLRHHLATRNP